MSIRPSVLLLLVLACGQGPGPVDAGVGGGTGEGGSGGGGGGGSGSEDAGSDAGVLAPCSTTRSIVDRPDEGSPYVVRVLYVLPSDGVDEALDTNGKLCTSVRAWTGWLSGQTGGTTLRLDTENGVIDIGFVRLNKTDVELRGSSTDGGPLAGYAYLRNRLETELQAGGHILPTKLYAAYYGGTSPYSCGGGAYPPNLIGHVGALYLKGQPGGAVSCETNPWGESLLAPGYLDYAMLHELVHTLGFVPDVAPNEHSSGHVYDTNSVFPGRDLMYSQRNASDPPWDIFAAQGLILDINSDDYYGHGGAFLDLSRSAFLEPAPANAVLPPGWP